MRLTSAELIVLGLVIEQPRHGYDVDRTITERGIRQWADLAFSSIYYVLGKLESRGFVKSEAGSRPRSRRVYSATEAGLSAASAATADLLGAGGPSVSPFVVGLANSELIDAAGLESLMRARTAALTEQLSRIEAARSEQGELPASAQLVFSHTIAMLVAERDWLTTLELGDALTVKTDFKNQIATYTAPSDSFQIVTVPAMQFLMIDGHGDPNKARSYADALTTIYPVAYKLKFFSKNELDRDYTVMPLEALWWSEDMGSFAVARDKSQWKWTAMIMAPDWITAEHFEAARETVRLKGEAPAIDAIRLETLHEGLAVQVLHTGPYDDEGPLLERMHYDFIPSNSFRMTGKHHEVYLSDPRRTTPEKLKTILRQPVTRTDG